jgi:hypothetical protein
MQLNGLLEKLQALFSPAFLISSLTPVICFIIVNGTILGRFFPPVNAWLQNVFLLDSVPKTIFATVSIIIVLIAAYVFSTFNLILRETLQGKYLPRRIAEQLKQRETKRFDKLEKQLTRVKQITWGLRISSGPWKEELRQARDEGAKHRQCNYSVSTPPGPKIREFQDLRSKGAVIEDNELKGAVTLLKHVLSEQSAELPAHEDSQRLDRDHEVLVALIDYAGRRVEDEYIRLYNEREFNFSLSTIAATRLGNIAESVRGYAQSRYAMNLDFFWMSFQKVLQNETAFYKTIQDAKTQLDFMVSMFWLTVASTAFWMLVLPLVARGWLPLLGAAVVGPFLARSWYLIAVQNYRSFADLLRSSIDLFRFELLKTFKISLPLDVEAERLIWDQLKRRLSYGEEVLICYNRE